MAHQKGFCRKALSTSGFEAQRVKEHGPFVEQRARRIGILLAMLGATLMVLAVVLGGWPW